MKKTHVLLSAIASLTLMPVAAGAQGIGVASWYGARHQGMRTSSGETFDQDGMTAASHDLPLGARVRVTLHETGRSVIVRVNDRMGARGAIIDLSRGAAQQIGLLGRGRGTVSIDPADSDPVEVAEAPDDSGDSLADTSIARRSRRRPHTRQLVSTHHCCRAASLVMAHRVVDRRPARHRL